MTGRGKGQLVQVEIYGQRYTLKATKDPSWVESIAAHVDRKMREISASTPTVDSLKVAILAAVNIADEFFQLKVEGEAIEDRIAEKAEQLSDLLEESLRERGGRP
jgi:cell division protein ZapA